MKDRTKESIVKWIIDIFNAKSSYNNGENQNLYAITVQLPHPNKSINTVNAQQRFEEAFSAYYAKQLRMHCSGRKTIRSRHKWDQPLVFLAFDMEGSRHGYQSSYPQCPHGHGLILFSEKQLQNFLKCSGAKRNADGGMKLVKPARDISVIEFQPLETPPDAQAFADYAVKHATKLTGVQDNYTPYSWYPYPSKHHPFWKEYGNERQNQPTVERIRADRAADRFLDTGRARGTPFLQSGHYPA